MKPIPISLVNRPRFESYLKRDEGAGCLLWTGSLRDGYGQFKIRRQPYQAHRVAFVLAGNEIPTNAPNVLHRCDVRHCCEPAHLFLGTIADNLDDMARKWRGRTSKRGLPFGVTIVRGKWYMAQLTHGGAQHYLGCYSTAEEASEVATREKCRLLGL